jgi:sugar/nucleoside kinase (ribokinase family)
LKQPHYIFIINNLLFYQRSNYFTTAPRYAHRNVTPPTSGNMEVLPSFTTEALSIEHTLKQASMASSLAVSRMGAASSIPYMSEVAEQLNNLVL